MFKITNNLLLTNINQSVNLLFIIRTIEMVSEHLKTTTKNNNINTSIKKLMF